MDTAIYGLELTYSPHAIYLSSIDPGTAAFTRVSANSLDTAVGGPGSVINPSKRVFYLNLHNKLVGIDLKTGSVVSSPVMSDATFSEFQYSPVDSTIYGLSYGPGWNGCYLAKINPTTGLVSRISATTVASMAYAANTTIDPYRNIYYFMAMGDTLVGVNMSTGKAVTRAVVTDYLDLMVFNCDDSVIYGITQASGTGGLFLSRINPAIGTVTTISPTPVNLYLMAASGSTIDVQRRIYYCIMNNTFMGMTLAAAG